MDEQRIPGYCPLCISRCGCISVVRDGVLVAVEPDPEHLTGSALCIKGKAAPELVYSPERLLTPLKRTQPKGAADPGWVPICWDEALAIATQRLQAIAAEHGPEAVAFSVTTPSGTAIADSFVWINRLARAFGSPNTVFATENCNWHKDFAPLDTLGSALGLPDYENTGCILLWGFNPATTWLAQATEIAKAKKRGAKLIVVDPRRAGLANQADEWLPLRPGRDGILALSLAGVLLDNGWFDAEFVRRWSNGPFLIRSDNGQLLTEADIIDGGSPSRHLVWDRQRHDAVPVDAAADGSEEIVLFGEYSVATLGGPLVCYPAFEGYARECRRYPPEQAAALTGVPAAQILATARLLHEHGPVSYYTWTGTAQQDEAAQIGRALLLLHALTGGIDAPGGNVQFTKPPIRNLLGQDLLSPGQRAKCLGFGARPLGPGRLGWISSRDLYRAVVTGAPYPVKALVSFGGNPQLTKPHLPEADAALRGLDFYLHTDMFLNPTASYADIILPVASPWERGGLAPGLLISQQAERRVQLRRPAIAPRGEARDDTAIVFELARRLGLDAAFFDGDREAALAHLLEPTGLTPQQLRAAPRGIDLPLATRYHKYREAGFNTPSGRLEVYASRYAEEGYAPWPRFAPAEDAQLPLLLTSHKTVHFCHSQHRQLPRLRGRMSEPEVEMHPNTAAARGIAAGAWVRVTTAEGTLRARAVFNAAMSEGVVSAQYGWWQACEALGLPGYAMDGEANANYNRLISGEAFDPISSSNALRGCRCELTLAE